MSSAGEEDSDASVILEHSFEEGLEEADDPYEEEAEDEETRRLAEEIRMLEEETARLALEAVDEDEYDEDGATEEEEEPQVNDEGDVAYDSEEEDAETELSNVQGETEEQSRRAEDGEETTDDETEEEEEEEEQKEDDDPTIRGILAAVAQLQLTDGGDEPEEDETVDEQVTEATSVVEAEDGADAGDEEELTGPAEIEQADEDVEQVEKAAEENEESSEQESEEERNHQDVRESEESSKGDEEKPSRRRAHEEVREEEEEEEEKPVVRRRLRKLAEVKAERESKKKGHVPMFSDESEEEEEEAPSNKKQRGKEARPAAKGGMMDKLRMLARQTGSEAIEDAAQSDGSESEAKEERDSEDEHDSEFPTDEQMEGDDYEAECIAEDDDEKRPPTPTNKAKTLQKVKTEREVEREEKKAHKSEAIEQKEAEEEGEEEEESEEEETPSWKRLRKFVEVKDEPRTSEKKSDSSGKKKAATAAELKGKTKDAVKTEAKKGKNADEDFVEEEVERVQLWKGLSIPAKMWDGLYPYQKVCHTHCVSLNSSSSLVAHSLRSLQRGVEFMWSLYTKKTGGILGVRVSFSWLTLPRDSNGIVAQDEMGLGKTIQALVLVLGALTSGRAKRVLIVMPLSVMKNWENELMKWSDNGAMLESRGMGICIMHGAMNKKKNEIKDKVCV